MVEQEKVADQISFVPGASLEETVSYFWQSGIHLNACPTGGLDKAVIGAMLGGAIPVVANEAFREALSDYTDRLLFRHGDAAEHGIRGWMEPA